MSAQPDIVNLCDRIGRERLEHVIREFHLRVLVDPVLGHYFHAIPDVEEHIIRFTEFWWIGMGGASNNPPDIDMIGKHQHLKPSRSEMNRWLGLFAETVNELLPEELATQWNTMTASIARRLQGIVSD